MDIADIGRWLIAAGLAVAAVGAALVAGGTLGLGRLPGDLDLGAGRVRFYLPLTTSIIMSFAATVILNLALRR